jgi:glyoxalase superfamily protein
MPCGDVPGRVHEAELDRQHERAVALDATVRHDRSADADEPLRVYADPAGHLFCVFVAASVPVAPS